MFALTARRTYLESDDPDSLTWSGRPVLNGRSALARLYGRTGVQACRTLVVETTPTLVIGKVFKSISAFLFNNTQEECFVGTTNAVDHFVVQLGPSWYGE